MTLPEKKTAMKETATNEQVIKNTVDQVQGITLFACLKDDQHDRSIVLLQEPVSNRKRKKVIRLLKERGLQCKVIVYSGNTRKFVDYIFHPVKAKNFQFLGREIRDRLHVFFHPDDYLEATTEENKHLARLLLGRYHGIRTIRYFSTFTKHQHATKWMKFVSQGGPGR